MPRLTARVFTDLGIWMSSFGLVIGLVFPPMCLLLGLPAFRVITPLFFAATVTAGLMVGAVNYCLARLIVGRRLRVMADRMTFVERQLAAALFSHDWSGCKSSPCLLPIDSNDEVGSAAAAFNRLVVTLSRSHDVEDAMRRFSSMLSTSTDLETLGDESIQMLMADIGAESGALLVLERGELRVAAARGQIDSAAVAANCHIVAAMRTSEIVELDPDCVLGPAREAPARPGARLVVAPIAFNSLPLGAVVLATPAPPDLDQVALLDQLRADLGLAVNNAQAHERLETLAAVDPLTDAYNRRFGLARLEEELARSARSGQPLGLLMFDVDRFKAVNDTHGHAAGDRVLREIANAARSVLRDGADVLIRYGGEEFLVLLTDIAEESVAPVAERLRQTVDRLRIAIDDAEIAVTVSVGVAVCECRVREDPEALLARVDTALYEAKALGRNRLAFAHSAVLD